MHPHRTLAHASQHGHSSPEVSTHSPLIGHRHYGAVGANQCRSQSGGKVRSGTLGASGALDVDKATASRGRERRSGSETFLNGRNKCGAVSSTRQGEVGTQRAYIAMEAALAHRCAKARSGAHGADVALDVVRDAPQRALLVSTPTLMCQRAHREVTILDGHCAEGASTTRAPKPTAHLTATAAMELWAPSKSQLMDVKLGLARGTMAAAQS